MIEIGLWPYWLQPFFMVKCLSSCGKNSTFVLTITISIIMMNENQDPKQGQLQIELPQETAHGEYANFAIITHSSSDFVVDFASVLPGMPKAQVRSRVILAPEHAKRLLMALQENIVRYEREFGAIKIPNQEPRTIAPFNVSKGEA
jgi:hypothetical protein